MIWSFHFYAEQAKNNVPKSNKISFDKVDIQDLPYEDKSFNIVIANYIQRLVNSPEVKDKFKNVFTLQNGENVLKDYFNFVRKKFI